MKTTFLKPLLPLRDIVIFPSMVVPLFVGRKITKALQSNEIGQIYCFGDLCKFGNDDPSSRDLSIWMYGKVSQLLKLQMEQ